MCFEKSFEYLYVNSNMIGCKAALTKADKQMRVFRLLIIVSI